MAADPETSNRFRPRATALLTPQPARRSVGTGQPDTDGNTKGA